MHLKYVCVQDLARSAFHTNAEWLPRSPKGAAFINEALPSDDGATLHYQGEYANIGTTELCLDSCQLTRQLRVEDIIGGRQGARDWPGWLPHAALASPSRTKHHTLDGVSLDLLMLTVPALAKDYLINISWRVTCHPQSPTCLIRT